MIRTVLSMSLLLGVALVGTVAGAAAQSGSSGGAYGPPLGGTATSGTATPTPRQRLFDRPLSRPVPPATSGINRRQNETIRPIPPLGGR